MIKNFDKTIRFNKTEVPNQTAQKGSKFNHDFNGGYINYIYTLYTLCYIRVI